MSMAGKRYYGADVPRSTGPHPDPLSECHCGKDGHALNSINCPVHGRPQAAIDNLTNHQEQCDMDGVMIKVSRQALSEVLDYLAATNWRS